MLGAARRQRTRTSKLDPRRVPVLAVCMQGTTEDSG
jgi:hypothetical protein